MKVLSKFVHLPEIRVAIHFAQDMEWWCDGAQELPERCVPIRESNRDICRSVKVGKLPLSPRPPLRC